MKKYIHYETYLIFWNEGKSDADVESQNRLVTHLPESPDESDSADRQVVDHSLQPGTSFTTDAFSEKSKLTYKF